MTTELQVPYYEQWIGTYGVVQDTSGMAAMEGVRVHVIRAGPSKAPARPARKSPPSI